jgi:23S rRNA-/tRNA-specific pseudouridylate synthase
LRVHLASLGSPIMGDSTYGGKPGLLLSEIKRRSYREGKTAERPLLERLALHAEQITLTHPTTGERLTIRAELPPDLAQILEALRRYG